MGSLPFPCLALPSQPGPQKSVGGGGQGTARMLFRRGRLSQPRLERGWKGKVEQPSIPSCSSSHIHSMEQAQSSQGICARAEAAPLGGCGLAYGKGRVGGPGADGVLRHP